MERTKEEITEVIRKMTQGIAELESGCGVCLLCRRDRSQAQSIRIALDAIQWMQGDDNTMLGRTNQRFAEYEANQEARMRTEKEQATSVAELFRRSGVKEP